MYVCVMNGKELHSILRYLHVCSLNDQPAWDSPYNPACKVKEFQALFEEGFKITFICAEQLSLDNMLIYAFG